MFLSSKPLSYELLAEECDPSFCMWHDYEVTDLWSLTLNIAFF